MHMRMPCLEYRGHRTTCGVSFQFAPCGFWALNSLLIGLVVGPLAREPSLRALLLFLTVCDNSACTFCFHMLFDFFPPSYPRMAFTSSLILQVGETECPASSPQVACLEDAEACTISLPSLCPLSWLTMREMWSRSPRDEGRRCLHGCARFGQIQGK